MSRDSLDIGNGETTVSENPGDVPTCAAILSALDGVTDPELDRSIVELEYIDDIEIDAEEDGAHVDVSFTLPTAWCSPAFAWMMALDGREAVEGLSGVARCSMRLREHMHAREVTVGVNNGHSFDATFPDADGGIAEVRSTLDAKARLARQYDAVETLLTAGVTHEQIALLTRDDCRFFDEYVAVGVREGAVEVVVDVEPLRQYLDKAMQTGRVDEGGRLFRTPEGDDIEPDEAELVHRRARLAHVNMSGQGGVCDALHESRRAELARQ